MLHHFDPSCCSIKSKMANAELQKALKDSWHQLLLQHVRLLAATLWAIPGRNADQKVIRRCLMYLLPFALRSFLQMNTTEVKPFDETSLVVTLNHRSVADLVAQAISWLV